MTFESHIAKSLSERQDIYTLKLDIQAEKEYLENLRPALQTNRDDYRNIRFFLSKAAHLVNKKTEKEKTKPALKKDRRWLRTVYQAHRWQTQAQERRDALQREYATFVKDYTEHTEILRHFEAEYRARIRLYAEEREKAEESFLHSTLSSPRMK